MLTLDNLESVAVHFIDGLKRDPQPALLAEKFHRVQEQITRLRRIAPEIAEHIGINGKDSILQRLFAICRTHAVRPWKLFIHVGPRGR